MGTMKRSFMVNWILVLSSYALLAGVAQAQAPSNSSSNATAPPPPPPPPPLVPNLAPDFNRDILSASDACVGVYVVYQLIGLPVKIAPFTPTNASAQPYRFQSTVSLINNGFEPVPQWQLSIGFQHSEVIAEADGVLFLLGSSPPGLEVGNDTQIVGLNTPGLMTSIDTAGNIELMSYNFTLIGTEFGVNASGVPFPANLSLINDGYTCGIPTVNQTQMGVCCLENQTIIDGLLSNLDSGFLPRQTGDVILSYDVMSAYQGSYLAQVSIELENALGRIDNWNLTWDWQQGEFIKEMKGAQILGPNDQDKCIYGAAAVTYQDMDFTNVMSCSPKPVMVDLPVDLKDDPIVGIPHCCRNGTLLSGLVDPTYNKSNFQVNVFKLPPHTAQNDLSPPINWNIGEGYSCGQPIQVSPSEFTPEALHSSSAVASWQVVCNVTQVKQYNNKCCVSFSAYYNDSAVPCPTCSCGLTKSFPWNGQTCNPYLEASLLPYNALLLPPSNRTAFSKQLAQLNHYLIPNPLPCADNCGVAINWHVYSNYANGWSARMTVFNWDTTQVADWFAGVELPVAYPGFQKAYSFNYSSTVPNLNNTIFVEGQNYFNDYLKEKDSSDNPGKVQSVLSFDKRKTPGISYTNKDLYPTKVWFNGEECAIPDMFPTGSGWRILPTFHLGVALFAAIFLLGGADAMRIL